MKINTLAMSTGLCLALTLGIYLASNTQAAGNCTIGGEIGPGVKVVMNDQQKTRPPEQKQDQQQGQPAKAASQDQGQKADKPADKKPAPAPLVPIIAPDEGC
ncbi:MAG: hypothetical protein KQH53_10445 [Desulfarculaceae bacterium]|nr:hypothetical protein [Desulfarculaceae bacterium]